ncbi:MAG: flagellar export protein FliJ [Nitrosospira sp.]|nr:flagellar export protein FliJ [Nitrosospira sp.]
MPKPSALETLIELAQTRKDDAARRFGALNTEGMDMEAKLSLLMQYSDEYRARFQESMRRGLTASDWRNYHEFLNKLDDAITQQRAALDLMVQRVAAGEVAWLSARRTLNSYDTLAQRQTQEGLLRARRREQRETDEHASNAVARREPS